MDYKCVLGIYQIKQNLRIFYDIIQNFVPVVRNKIIFQTYGILNSLNISLPGVEEI